MITWLPSAVVTHLWQSTLFVALVWLATLALRRNGARVRYWLWTAASVKFLVPFSWLVSLGAQFEWRTAPAIAQPAVSFVMDEVFAPPMLAAAAPAAAAPETVVLPWLLMGVWFVGSTAMLFWWWRQWIPVRSALRAATPLSLGTGFDTRGLTVMSSPSMFEPGVLGILHPVLLVPESLIDRLTRAQVNALLAHERCHVRCHDNLAAALHMAVEAIFWFHPLVWWIESRMIDERERACDEEVLRTGSQPGDYAEGILEVCRCSVASPLTCVAGVSGSNLRRRIESIMRHETGRAMTISQRLALAFAACAVIGGPVGAGAMNAETSSRAQEEEPTPAQFEVASIKRNPSIDAAGSRIGPQPGGRFVMTNGTVWSLIALAYNLDYNNGLVNAPAWLQSERYDVNARVAEGASPSLDEIRLMVQALLKERFRLVARHETREQPGYALVTAPGGPRLRQTQIDCEARRDAFVAGSPLPPPPQGSGCGIRARADSLTSTGASMVTLARTLTGLVGRVVVDETGLDGYYDFGVQFAPARLGASDAVDSSRVPSLFTVLEEQLGLRLVSERVAVPVLVIDSIERPTPD